MQWPAHPMMDSMLFPHAQSEPERGGVVTLAEFKRVTGEVDSMKERVQSLTRNLDCLRSENAELCRQMEHLREMMVQSIKEIQDRVDSVKDILLQEMHDSEERTLARVQHRNSAVDFQPRRYTQEEWEMYESRVGTPIANSPNHVVVNNSPTVRDTTIGGHPKPGRPGETPTSFLPRASSRHLESTGRLDGEKGRGQQGIRPGGMPPADSSPPPSPSLLVKVNESPRQGYQTMTSLPQNIDLSSFMGKNRSPKVPKFNGKGQLLPWLIQIAAIAKSAEWDETEKAVQVMAALEGNATNLLQGLSLSQLGSYEGLITRLKNRYDPPD